MSILNPSTPEAKDDIKVGHTETTSSWTTPSHPQPSSTCCCCCCCQYGWSRCQCEVEALSAGWQGWRQVSAGGLVLSACCGLVRWLALCQVVIRSFSDRGEEESLCPEGELRGSRYTRASSYQLTCQGSLALALLSSHSLPPGLSTLFPSLPKIFPQLYAPILIFFYSSAHSFLSPLLHSLITLLPPYFLLIFPSILWALPSLFSCIRSPQ